MKLTAEQEKMLAGKKGKGTQKAMEILVGLGDIYDADSLIPIQSAHISGISMKTSGEAGLNFIKELVENKAKVSVPTTINPAGMDLQKWEEMGVPKDFAEKQKEMVEAYRQIGAEPTCTCSPYLLDQKPSYGDHLAWSESSAIVYVNSVVGARTNREGGPSALASAITGLTPKYGYHLDENRQGSLRVNVDSSLFENEKTFPYSVLGYWIGQNHPEEVPVIESVNPSPKQHKALGAGMGASGAVTLYHIPKVTPEAKNNPKICETEKEVNFGKKEFESIIEKLNQTSNPDLICLGCPHFSLEELEEIISSEFKEEKEIWVCLSRELKEKADSKGLTSQLERKNVKLVCDTCMVVAPLSEMDYESIGVNSTKAAHYAPSLNEVEVQLAPIDKLIK